MHVCIVFLKLTDPLSVSVSVWYSNTSRGPLGDPKKFKAFQINGIPQGIQTAIELLTKTLQLKGSAV